MLSPSWYVYVELFAPSVVCKPFSVRITPASLSLALAVQALLLQSLKLLLSLPADVVLPLSNRLASGLLILIQVPMPINVKANECVEKCPTTRTAPLFSPFGISTNMAPVSLIMSRDMDTDLRTVAEIALAKD